MAAPTARPRASRVRPPPKARPASRHVGPARHVPRAHPARGRTRPARRRSQPRPRSVTGTRRPRPMADEPQTIRAIHWRDVFPFLNLFRAFRVAIHPSKLVLGLLALLTIYAGGRILDGLWSLWASPYQPLPRELERYQEYAARPDRASPFSSQEADFRTERINEYAGLLRQHDLVKDPQQSQAAAANYDHYSDLKAGIFKHR